MRWDDDPDEDEEDKKDNKLFEKGLENRDAKFRGDAEQIDPLRNRCMQESTS